MPLYDHFHPPLSERRPWESFHATWCGSLADYLNDDLLPSGYIALEQVHFGAAVEIDVATYAEESSEAMADGSGTATLTRTVWTPATAPLTFPANFTDQFSVEIHSTEGGRTLVAAIELLSPGNKERQSKRRLFAAKCAAYLRRSTGLVLIDTVTSRQANLHNELLDLFEVDAALRMPAETSLYTVGYRPLAKDGDGWIDCWPMPLSVGQPLPTVPLSLSADCCLPLDLEAAYANACRRRHVEEAA